MKTKIFSQLILVLLVLSTFNRCAAIGDIFQAGVGVGIFVVVIIVVIIIFIATRFGKGGNK